MGDFKVKVKESGTWFDRTAFVKEEGNFGFNTTKGQRGTATVPLIIPPAASYAPQIGWPVFIYEVNTSTAVERVVFAGTIEQMEIDWIADFGYHIFTLQLTSLEQELDVVMMFESEFTNQTAASIVNQILGFLTAAVSMPVPISAGTISTGATVTRKYDGKQSILSVIQQLATDSGYVAYIDPEDQKLYFTAKNARATGFTLTGAMILWETLKWEQSRSDFVGTQVITVDPNTLPPEKATFNGTGTQNVFTLPAPIRQIAAAYITSATPATVVGTFTGQPNDGDTITITPPFSPTITPPTYTFKNTIDNTIFGQIKIGATTADTIQNLVDAINGLPASQGSTISLPTWANQAVTAEKTSSTTVTLTAKQLGTAGNAIAIGEATANFTWAGSFLSGGADGTSQALSCGPLLGGNYDLGYTPGSSDVQLQVQPAAHTQLVVEYYSDMSGLVQLSSGQATVLGIQDQAAIMRARGATQGADAILQGTAMLAEYAKLPAKFTFSTYTPGFYAGRWQTVAIGSNPSGANVLLDGDWVIQSVSATYTPGFGGLTEPWGHFKYTVSLINTAQIATPQDMLSQMLDTGPFNSTPPTGTQQVDTPPSVIPQAGTQVFQRTFLIKDCTVKNDAGDHVFIWTRDVTLSPITRATAQAQRIVGVLRKTISSNLTVRFNLLTNASPPATAATWLATIPAGTAVNRPIETKISGTINDGDIIYPDIVASDGQASDAYGIASFTVLWE
jgi:hypothetical protein